MVRATNGLSRPILYALRMACRSEQPGRSHSGRGRSQRGGGRSQRGGGRFQPGGGGRSQRGGGRSQSCTGV
ncbi:hypothetical protein DY251_11305 [Mesorhizobium denitrificans]|uniref:Uncharacterized protein n=1 Tax=Mesorhizobium denitrificans TaxID=2294114 RepID=A0A371XEA3_9HYPH|nr:hypothetical protein DY251_11305 [Mesorhizobium denitrificans]